ncbi:MAG TPA: carboxylesterase family protein [Chthoniobacterales bacterium]
MRSRSVWMAVCLIYLQFGYVGMLTAQNELQPIVKIERGLLQGTHLDSNPNRAAFLGVQYAAPPIGELRWKPPQPAPKWSGTRKAVNYGSPCPQLPARWFPYIEGNEDCLYLNIWTADVRSNANRPVLVYFHGGSNTQGYSQMTPLGPPLSRMGLVVVSANYRLGPFGFLAHPALTAESKHHSSGNYGLLDQLQALQWVKENIREFGGDPGRVTVMGQSAGAVDICLLMASPLSKGLFQRAILESGECQDTLNEDIRVPIKYNSIDTTGEHSGERLAMDLGVPSGPGLLQKLRDIPASEILKTWKSDPGLHFDAIVDGWVVPKQPVQIFAEAQQMHVPILVGSNADEATVFGHNDLKTVDDYKRHLQQETGEYSNKEFQAYSVNADADVPIRSVELESDEFACGAYSIAQAMTKSGVKSYLYYFTYADPGKRARLGAHHGEELFFLSDSFPIDWEHTDKDQELGKLMRGYWVEFAKTGDPNFDSAPHWTPYDVKSNENFEIGKYIGAHRVSERVLALESIMNEVVAR